MKQFEKLSNIFAKAARGLGLLGGSAQTQDNAPPKTPTPRQNRQAQKMRQQRAFSALQKMEIQREFEIQNAVNAGANGTRAPAGDNPPPSSPPVVETTRTLKPIKTVRFKKPKTDG